MKITFSDFSEYQLGIFWGIASYSDRFVFRCKDRYFLEVINKTVNNKIYEQQHKGEKQYVLKSGLIDINTFENNNWINRNSATRDMPRLSNYKDFLRGYIELHSKLDYSTRYKCNGSVKYKALRLRIYANWNLIDSINAIINREIPNVKLKTPQSACNDTTKILYYHSLDEIQSIFNYIYSKYEHFPIFWEDANEKFKRPTIGG